MRAYLVALAIACAAAIPAAWLYSDAFAQQPGQLGNSPTPGGIVGVGPHIGIASGGLPTCSNCTLLDGSTDVSGQFTATSTSGTLTFQFGYTRQPICSLDSQTVTGAAWNVSNTAINLTTIVSGTTYTYICFARPGG